MVTVSDKLLKNETLWVVGIWAFVGAIVWDAYHDLWEIFHYDWYRVMQADMPDVVVCLRFIFSVALRVIALWAVAGVILRLDPYRKLLLGLCWFNALTVFLHHRYPSFVYISTYLNLNTEDFMQTVTWFGHTYYPGAIGRMLDAWAAEFFLAFLTIFFFSIPNVRRLFK